MSILQDIPPSLLLWPNPSSLYIFHCFTFCIATYATKWHSLASVQIFLRLPPGNLVIMRGHSSREQPMFQRSTLMFLPLCPPCKHQQSSVTVPFFCDSIGKKLPSWDHSLSCWPVLTPYLLILLICQHPLPPILLDSHGKVSLTEVTSSAVLVQFLMC